MGLLEELAIDIRAIKEAQRDINQKLEDLKKVSTADDELIPRLEKAKQLNVSLATLNNWEKAGIIKPVRIGRKVFFHRNEQHPKAPIIHTR